MAILGIDVGNYSVKVSPGINIKSLITREENLLGSGTVIEYDGEKFIVGEGSFETELNKSTKENFIPLLYAAICLATEDTFNSVVCGLPINQYKKNKDSLEKLIADNKIKFIKVNGQSRKVIISDFKVYPECVGAYYSLEEKEDMILIDIGGRTTDIAYVVNNRLVKSSTVAVGTLSIYKAIADKLNGDYSLDLDLQSVDRIIEKGILKVDNMDVDLKFITDILRDNFKKIKEDLDLKYPARTEKIKLIGGGSKLFIKAFSKRYGNCNIAENSIFANSEGFRKVGESLWQ